MNNACFQMKGSVVTTIVLELTHYSETAFSEQLKQRVEQAPMLFQKSPIVISLEKLKDDQPIDLKTIDRICRQAGLQPMAVKGGAPSHQQTIEESGLVHLPSSSVRVAASQKPEPPPLPEEVTKPVQAKQKTEIRNSMLVTQPVRSGQQIYAKDADLIIMSQVSEGAEVLADGHIHVYGSLRGRALAGVKGNQDARIFSSSLEAELLSVAGNFILSDDLHQREGIWKQPAQAFLQNGCLEIKTL